MLPPHRTSIRESPQPPGDARTRLVVVDDHAIVRAGVRALLGREPGVAVVAEATSTAEGERLVTHHAPDVLLLGVDVPGDPLGTIRRLRRTTPQLATVLLTRRGDVGAARAALEAGAAGYLVDDAQPAALLAAVTAVARGRPFLDPGIGAQLLGLAHEPGALTRREQEVLRLLALGHTNGEIAERLFLSVRTVETHRAQVQHKLGLSARHELVRHALRHGLVGPDTL